MCDLSEACLVKPDHAYGLSTRILLFARAVFRVFNIIFLGDVMSRHDLIRKSRYPLGNRAVGTTLIVDARDCTVYAWVFSLLVVAGAAIPLRTPLGNIGRSQ